MGAEYQITVTPMASWKAFSNPGGSVTIGEVGEPFTAEFDELDSGLSFTAGALAPEVNPAEGGPLPEQFCNATVSITRV